MVPVSNEMASLLHSTAAPQGAADTNPVSLHHETERRSRSNRDQRVTPAANGPNEIAPIARRRRQGQHDENNQCRQRTPPGDTGVIRRQPAIVPGRMDLHEFLDTKCFSGMRLKRLTMMFRRDMPLPRKPLTTPFVKPERWSDELCGLSISPAISQDYEIEPENPSFLQPRSPEAELQCTQAPRQEQFLDRGGERQRINWSFHRLIGKGDHALAMSDPVLVLLLPYTPTCPDDCPRSDYAQYRTAEQQSRYWRP